MLRAALRKQVDPRKVATLWAQHVATKADMPGSTPADWVRVNIRLEMDSVAKILDRIWASGTVFGEQAAAQDLGMTIGLDWSKWKPGDPAAAALVDPPRALYDLLKKRDIVLKGLSDTTVDQIGAALARSLDQGLGAEDTAAAVDEAIDDPKRALVIARTETARAETLAAQDAYKASGVGAWTWVVGDPVGCICVELAGQTANIGEEFTDGFGNPSGITMPPAHPNCVCAVSPADSPFDMAPEDFDPEAVDPSLVEMSVEADTVKYDEDQPRDDSGRWTDTGAGGGEQTSDTGYRMSHRPGSSNDDVGSPAHNLEQTIPGFYERPEIYRTGMPEADKESIAALMAIRDKPDALVTMYRAVPKDVDQILPGDWVTLSRSYAETHNESNLNGEGHIISMQVPAQHLWFPGDSINEFGYDPSNTKLFASRVRKEFNPDQARDESGRWTDEGGGTSGGTDSAGRSLPEPKNTPAKPYDPQNPPKDLPPDKKGYATHVAVQAAKEFREKAQQAEQKITNVLLGLADRFEGKMEGLQYRLKSEDSLARKIDLTAEEQYDGDHQQAAEAIRDAIRYTMNFDSENYTSNVQSVLTTLENQGYSAHVKNYWQEGNTWRGINAAMIDPEGNKFELQFHTPDSFTTKMDILHPIYEQSRSTRNSAEQTLLESRMIALASGITMPADVQTIGTLRRG